VSPDRDFQPRPPSPHLITDQRAEIEKRGANIQGPARGRDRLRVPVDFPFLENRRSGCRSKEVDLSPLKLRASVKLQGRGTSACRRKARDASRQSAPKNGNPRGCRFPTCKGRSKLVKRGGRDCARA
jgi:hypothetical protein